MARLVDQGFQVCHETMEKMKLMVARGETSALVQERVWQEMHSAFGERRPSAFIQTLRACGALGVLLPEVDALYGVPQPEQHHPEVDTGIHVELCLDVAANLGGSPAVVFAVLMHDLGKGVTPKSEWPRHIGHESSGLPLVRAVCERLGTPREFKRLAEKVTRHHLNVHQVESLRSKTVLRILEDTDAFRRQASFEALLLACEADARGRAGHESAAYPQRETFMALRNAAASVEAGPLLEQGYAGPELGEAIRGARIKAISAARAQSEL